MRAEVYAFPEPYLTEIVSQVFSSKRKQGRRFVGVTEADLIATLPRNATEFDLAGQIDRWVALHSLPPHDRKYRPELTRWFGYGRS